MGVLVFESLPAGEAILYTGAFTVMGLTFGLAFFRLYGEAWARRWATTLALFLIAGCATAATATLLPSVEEALLASVDNGSVARAVTMSEPRSAHTATLLPGGRVLLIGGMISVRGDEVATASTEIYDPANNSFAEAGRMQASRYKHSAVPLEDGRVMILGGSNERDWDGRRQSVEIYNPASGRSQLIATMNRARFKFPNAVAVAGNGNVIVSG